MRQLVWMTNGGYDSIIRIDNGYIVGAWTQIKKKDVSEFLKTEYAGDWDVQDASGLTDENGVDFQPPDYGDVVAILSEDSWIFSDIADSRAEYFKVVIPRD